MAVYMTKLISKAFFLLAGVLKIKKIALFFVWVG